MAALAQLCGCVTRKKTLIEAGGRNCVGIPKISAVRSEPSLGCARIHGELLKIGFEIAQSTLASQKGAAESPMPSAR